MTRPAALAADLAGLGPGIDVAGEIRAAGIWLRTHPERRKHKGNAFLFGWIKRAQDRNGGRTATDAPPAPETNTPPAPLVMPPIVPRAPLPIDDAPAVAKAKINAFLNEHGAPS